MKKQQTPTIKKETITFLKDLSKNNNRDWFTKHKDRYQVEQENMLAFAENLLEIMRGWGANYESNECRERNNLENRSLKGSYIRLDS